LFLDTSAFAKRYVAEPGSDRVLAHCARADALVVSAICLPELVSTLSRLVRERSLSKTDYRKLKTAMLGDLADIDICPVSPAVIEQATALLEAHPLRAMDAIHVASALACQCDLFLTADRRQLAAARSSGLKVADAAPA
jgi:predicted nucleic acid-binding protein